MSPAAVLIIVDLPDPFSPTMAWTSPGRHSKLTLLSATTPGYVLVTSFSVRPAGVVSGLTVRSATSEITSLTSTFLCLDRLERQGPEGPGRSLRGERPGPAGRFRSRASASVLQRLVLVLRLEGAADEGSVVDVQVERVDDIREVSQLHRVHDGIARLLLAIRELDLRLQSHGLEPDDGGCHQHVEVEPLRLRLLVRLRCPDGARSSQHERRDLLDAGVLVGVDEVLGEGVVDDDVRVGARCLKRGGSLDCALRCPLGVPVVDLLDSCRLQRLLDAGLP